MFSEPLFAVFTIPEQVPHAVKFSKGPIRESRPIGHSQTPARALPLMQASVSYHGLAYLSSLTIPGFMAYRLARLSSSAGHILGVERVG